MKATTTLSILSIVAAVLLSTPATTAIGRTTYVDADAGGANDGTSWENAYIYLQDALADANSAGEPSEILVAEGLYTPDKTSAAPAGTGDRNATFQLATDVALRGGYAGFGQPAPDTRDIDAYQTILSGDLADNDANVWDLRDLPDHSTRSDNSYHVLVASGAESTAILEGFTVTGGNSNGIDANSYGGGMFNLEGDPTIANCTFVENSAGNPSTGGSGGAIDNEAFSNFYYNTPTIIDCMFYRNYAVSSGGAISNYLSAPAIIACTFMENRSHAGAALEFDHATTLAPTELKYCTFVRNTANSYGGALYNQYSNPTITNCLFEANVALDPSNGVGGAIANWRSQITLLNCTIAGNRAPRSGSAMESGDSLPTITNCIIWDNPNGHTGIATNGDFSIGYCCIQYGWVGEGNTDEDPLFAQPGVWDPNGTSDDETDDFWIRGDYHVKSAAGRWDPNSVAWVSDDVTSPCIDTGYYEDPVGDELLPNGWLINMGVFGGTAQASMSLCPSGHPADCYTDGIVNMLDLFMLSQRWLAEGLFIPEDIDRDGAVNFVDLAIMLSQWQNINTIACGATLLTDGFEHGEWNSLWTQDDQHDWYISNNNVADGDFSAQVDGKAEDATLTSIPMDLQDMSVATVGFVWYINKDFDNNEYLAFDISTDGGTTWQEKARLDGNGDFEGQWRSVLIKLRNISTLQIRFRAKASGSGEKANVDLVTVDASYH